MTEQARSKDTRIARAQSATKPVLMAIALTAAACAAVAFAYTKLAAVPEPKACHCVDAASSSEKGPQSGELVRAIAALANAKVEETPTQPSVLRVVEMPAQLARDSSGAFEPSAEERQAKEQADADALDAQLGAEEVDPFWAPRTERATADAVARLGNDLRVAEVTCRESLCRARLIHRDARLAASDLEGLLNMSVIGGEAMVISPPGEAGGTVLYFSRKGMSLSVLQPPVYLGQLPTPGPDDLEPPSEALP